MTSYQCKACGRDFEPEEIQNGKCPFCGAEITEGETAEAVTDPDRLAAIFAKAAALQESAASFGDWETAAKLFGSLGAYGGAADRAAFCRQKAEEAQKEAVYLQALKRQGTTADALRGKAELLRTVAGYKDADALAEEYEKQADALEAELLAARREQEERKQQETADSRKKSGQRRRLILVLAAAAAVVIAGVLIVSLWILPSAQYDRGVELFRAGDFRGAKEIFDGIPHFKDSADYLGQINGRLGEDALRSGDYPGALEFFEQTGGREEFRPQLKEVLDFIFKQGMDHFYAGRFKEAQDCFDKVDQYESGDEDYKGARAFKQLCRAIRMWNGEEVKTDKLNLKEAGFAVGRVAEGTWYCEATGQEISLGRAAFEAEADRLTWQGYTVEFHSATTLTLKGDGAQAGEYEKE